MPVELERLTQGARVRSPGEREAVTLTAVTPGAYWDFVFEADVKVPRPARAGDSARSRSDHRQTFHQGRSLCTASR